MLTQMSPAVAEICKARIANAFEPAMFLLPPRLITRPTSCGPQASSRFATTAVLWLLLGPALACGAGGALEVVVRGRAPAARSADELNRAETGE
jgi:hypothetical protein